MREERKGRKSDVVVAVGLEVATRKGNGGRAAMGIHWRRGIIAKVVEMLDRFCELVAFLSFEKELSDIFAPLFFFKSGGGFILLLFLIFVVHWAEAIFGVGRLVFCLRMLSFYFPDTFLLQG